MTLVLPQSLLDTIAECSRERAPREAVGVIALQREDMTMRLVELDNVADADHQYRAKPVDVLRLWQEMEDRGEVPHVIWHSHPNHAGRPSQHDIDHATVRGAFYLIYSVRDDEPRAFRIAGGAATEHRIVIKEG